MFIGLKYSEDDTKKVGLRCKSFCLNDLSTSKMSSMNMALSYLSLDFFDLV